MPSSARLKRIAQTVQILALMSTLPAYAQDDPGGFFTTSDKVKLHYLETGQGETILLVPGWLMPADIWQLQVQELSKNYHVVALDPRSQGQSDLTQVGNDPLRRSKDINELLDYLHVDSVVLVGWALGAFDCLAYLRQFGTDKVKALVLVDSPLAAASIAPVERSRFLKLFQTDRENANRNYAWSLFKKAPPKGFYKPLIQSAARVPTDIALATLDNTMPGENWGPNLRVLRQVPLLYAITPKFSTQAAYLQEVDPQARVEVFENSGHALFVDESDRFNALVKDFLQKTALNPASAAEPQRKGVNPPNPTKPAVSGSTPPSIPGQAASQQAPLPTATSASLPTIPSTPTPGLSTPTPVSSTGMTLGVTSSPTFFPSMTTTGTVEPTPTETATEVPPSPTAIPSLPFTERLSKAWNSILHGSNRPTPPATAAPTPRPRKEALKPAYLNAAPVQEGYFTTSDHVRLHYLEAGQGLTLVLIPGWLLPADIWKAQLEDLSQDYHVVALDPRSQGESDITPLGDEPVRQAKDIQELLDHLQLNSVVLVGWSHGGFQVLAYMGQFGTGRLYATVLVDSALGAASSPVSTGPQARFLEQFKTDRVRATRGFVWGLFKKPPPADFIHQLVEAATRPPTDIALALMNNAFPGERWQPSLQTIRQVPLLYAVTPKYSFQANYLTQVDPLARVEFFQDSGHALFFDEADHFDTVIRNFLGWASRYPAGLPEPQHKQAGPVPTHSFLENPK